MMSNFKVLDGKVAVITGCLKGIGRSTMDMFARNGCDIWACCQYEDESFSSHIKSLSQECGVEIMPLYFDFCSYDAIKAAAKQIVSTKKPVDILVNIAGMTRDALFHMVSMEQMKQVFEVNFFSQMLLTQYISKIMLKYKKGSIINISSISAIDGNVGQLSYSASKAALIGATKTLSIELASQGIRVNAIAPGVIKTEMTESLHEDAFKSHMMRSSLKHMGTPNEVAGAILFLASDMSSYITGQIIRVDGGIG